MLFNVGKMYRDHLHTKRKIKTITVLLNNCQKSTFKNVCNEAHPTTLN